MAQAEIREKYPAWVCIEELDSFEEVLAYVKRHAEVLSRAPMEDAATVAWGGRLRPKIRPNRFWNIFQPARLKMDSF